MHTINLLSKRDVAKDTPVYTFSRPADFQFRAGQYVTLKVSGGPFTDDRGDFRAFSIASAPYEQVIEFSMRRSASAFKRNIDSLIVGAQAEMTNAVGKFVLPEEKSDRPIVFLAGGVGITPVRSILRQAIFEKQSQRFVLFYSNRTPQDAPFFDEMNAYSGIDLTTVHTMTNLDATDESWTGERGFISSEMISRHMSDYRGSLFYVVGTDQFIGAMKEMLAKSGVDLDRVHADNFGSVTAVAKKI